MDEREEACRVARVVRELIREHRPRPCHGDDRYYFMPRPPGERGEQGAYDLEAVRRDFPALERRVHGRPLVWLDNAATTHKPRAVIEAISSFYERSNSNIHRSAHTLAGEATEAFDRARAAVAGLLGADPCEIVFVRGATEGLNLVASVLGRDWLRRGDEVVLTRLEHHANIVPWQLMAAERGVAIKVAEIDDDGALDLEHLAGLLGPRTRVVSVAHVSNVLGTVLPLRRVAELAHAAGALLVVDGAQGAPHLRVDVRQLGCDLYLTSGHKMYAPTGIGALYGRADLLAELGPWQGGGAMIDHVTFEQTRYQPPPVRFEAGTPHIAGAVGLAAAIDYLTALGIERVEAHGKQLAQYAHQALSAIPGLRRFGTAAERVGPVAFDLRPLDSERLGAALDRQGIALRTGHHCAQPTMALFGVEGMVRPSFGLYNTTAEIDQLVAAIERARHELA